jgi:uncharacterized protein (TIGR02453 family)
MKSAISFLKKLAKNNNREWFADNKKSFEEAKEEFEELVVETIAEIGKWDKNVRSLTPKDCIYRIYRDVRFSKDKTPYKTSFSALLSKDGRKGKGAINYLHIQPSQSFTAAGVYMPESNDLKAIRQEIDYNLKKFETILTNYEFKNHFGELSEEWKLKTLPKGYSADNPAIEYLRLKGFVVTKNYMEKEVLAKSFPGAAAHSFKIAQPLNTFLNSAIDGVE